MGIFLASPIQAGTIQAAPYAHQRSTDWHQLTLINDGVVDLDLRLRLIEGARRSIDVETFIFSNDRSTRLVTQALARQARRGVRVLLDHYGAIMPPPLQRELARAGVELRLFNVRWQDFDYRNHRKSLVVDDQDAIVGGRNLADEYFLTNERLTLLDRDLRVRGPLVATLTESFEAFWNYPGNQGLTTAPIPVGIARLNDADRFAVAFVNENPEDAELRRLVREDAATATPQELFESECRDLSFVTDEPRGAEPSRHTGREVLNRLAAAQESVVMESPSFSLTRLGKDTFADLLRRQVQVEFFTNSLESSDSLPLAAANYELRQWVKRGIKAYVHFKGEPDGVTAPPAKGRAAFMVHSKTYVIDGRDTMFGSFNLDSRSESINAELALFCDGNPALASALEASMRTRLADDAAFTRRRVFFSDASLARRLLFYPLLPIFRIFKYEL